MHLVRSAAFGVVAVSAGGCAEPNPCSGPNAFVAKPQTSQILELTCGETDLASVAVSGPCATGDAGPPYSVSDAFVSVTSPSPGVCHVELVFATGFTFTSDVTFVSKPALSCGDTAVYVGPAPGVALHVNNPVTTCLDGGPDAPAYDGTVNGDDAAPGADIGREAAEAGVDAEE
jgi:hypothetical protein